MRYFYFVLLLFFTRALIAQENPSKSTLKISITNKKAEGLDNALIKIYPDNLLQYSDSLGNATFKLANGIKSVIISHKGNVTKETNLKLSKNLDLKIVLADSSISLQEVLVKSQSMIDVNTTMMGKNKVEIQTLKKIPAFLGEIDVIKSISALPGVINSGEGGSGFYVRGGGTDQNLVLLDDMPIFNSSHLFGFFSVFNPDVLKDFTLLRSGISPKYGGRISSILEVETREISDKKLTLFAGISLVSAKIGLDARVGKKTSIILAARSANPNYFMQQFKDPTVNQSKANYYDLNFKINHKLNKNNSVLFSSYVSTDNFKFPYDTTYKYSNTLASLKWNHSFSAKLLGTLSLIYSKYTNEVRGLAENTQFLMSSDILNKQVKLDFFKGNQRGQNIEFGAGMGSYSINPGKLEILAESSNYLPVSLQKDIGREFWSYFNDELRINNKIAMAVGLRLSGFQKLGPSEVNIYAENLPKTLSNVVEIKSFNNHQVEKLYGGLEPRVSFKYSLSKFSSLKIGLTRMRQYLQLVTNSASVTPADVWRLANTNIKPQIADQLAIGYFYVPASQNFEVSIESYFKKSYNIIDYRDGSNIVLKNYLETSIVNNQGKAYGIESFVKKNNGYTTGWVSFTYSRSFLKSISNFPEEQINDGNYYPSNYDRPINFNAFLNFQFKKSPLWSFSLNATYSSGRPITAASSWFKYSSDFYYSNYFGRNNERMPSVQRLDIALLRKSPSTAKVKTEWGISVYNLLFRKNAFSTLFKHYYGAPPMAYKLSIIGVAVPSINFNIKI